MSDKPQDQRANTDTPKQPEVRLAPPKRKRWDLLLVAIAILVGLIGAYSSQLLWRSGQPVASDAEQEVATDAVERRDEFSIPPSASSASPGKSASQDAGSDSPLPATAAPLLEEVGYAIDRLVETFPNDLDCLEMKARFQKWTGKTDEAVKTWETCLDLNPAYAHAYLGMAEAAAKKGNHLEAADLARKSVQNAPGLFKARAVLAEALVNLGRPEEAIEVLEKSLQTDPRSYGYFLLGRAYTLKQQLEKAKENYQASIRKYPAYAEAHYGLARTCVRLGEADAAGQSMARYRELMAKRYPGRQGMDMLPESFETLCADAAILYTDTGRIYYAHQQPVEAERLWRRAAALSSGNIDCRQALAWLSRSEGRTAETIRWLEEVAKLDPENPNCWLEIGNLYLVLAQLRPAEEAFQKACAVAPQDAPGHAALAALYLRSGQRSAQALSLARAAVKLAPTVENYSLLAAACERNGDQPGAAEAKQQVAKLSASPVRP